jgi:hypothetical protein
MSVLLTFPFDELRRSVCKDYSWCQRYGGQDEHQPIVANWCNHCRHTLTARYSVRHTAHKHQSFSNATWFNKINSCTNTKACSWSINRPQTKSHSWRWACWRQDVFRQASARPSVRHQCVVVTGPRWRGLNGRVPGGGPTTPMIW